MWGRTNKAQEHSCPPQKSRGRGHRLDNCSCPIHDCLSTPCTRGSCVRVALKRVSENAVLTCETRGILTRTGCREAVDELSLFNYRATARRLFLQSASRLDRSGSPFASEDHVRIVSKPRQVGEVLDDLGLDSGSQSADGRYGIAFEAAFGK